MSGSAHTTAPTTSPRPPARSASLPKYCLHKPSGRARVHIDGHEIWLGPFDDPTSRTRYDQLIAEWLACGRRLPPAWRTAESAAVTVLDLSRSGEMRRRSLAMVSHQVDLDEDVVDRHDAVFVEVGGPVFLAEARHGCEEVVDIQPAVAVGVATDG